MCSEGLQSSLAARIPRTSRLILRACLIGFFPGKPRCAHCFWIISHPLPQCNHALCHYSSFGFASVALTCNANASIHGISDLCADNAAERMCHWHIIRICQHLSCLMHCPTFWTEQMLHKGLDCNVSCLDHQHELHSKFDDHRT